MIVLFFLNRLVENVYLKSSDLSYLFKVCFLFGPDIDDPDAFDFARSIKICTPVEE